MMSESSGSVSLVQQLRREWVSPGDLLTVLMIIGGDVIQQALGQLAGGYLTPVSFSFGWVAYSFSTLAIAVGDNRLLPLSDNPSIVINGKSGFVRDNRSWVLGRIIRDFERWMPPPVEEEVKTILETAHEADQAAAAKNPTYNGEPVPKRLRAGLCISVFRTSRDLRPGVTTKDWVFYSGIVVAIIQLGVSIIPFILNDDWLTFMITSAGILLAFAHGALPQWKAEKWHCRRQEKTSVLTTGNGAQHAMVIIASDANAFDLEDLASAEVTGFRSTRVGAAILTLLWFGLLITVAGMKQDPWFLMAVGGIGMMQNVVVAGASRKPSAHGIHLEFVECIARPKVMPALMALEENYPRLGASLLPTFFPGKLFKKEEEYWENAKIIAEEKKRFAENNKPVASQIIVDVPLNNPFLTGQSPV